MKGHLTYEICLVEKYTKGKITLIIITLIIITLIPHNFDSQKP